MARKKWAYLRDYFMRQHRAMVTFKSGSAASRKKKWFLYDAMSFLIPHVSDRPTSGNICDEYVQEDTCSEASTQDSTLTSQFVNMSSNNYENDTPVASTSQEILVVDADAATPQPTKKYKRKKDSQESIDQEILQTLKNIPNVSREEEDEDLLFFKALVPKMKCLNDIQKMELQGELHSVVLKHIKRARGVRPLPPTDGYPEPSYYSSTSAPEGQYYQYANASNN